MLRPLVLLWLAAPNALPEHQPDISRWAAARGFGPVREPQGDVQLPYDDTAASQIEALLEDARTAPSATAGVFEHLERLLTMHPHLPQAAWLSAERYALQARAEARSASAPAEGARATELEGRAVQLEGPRASPFGQVRGAPAGVPSSLPAAKLQIEGLRPRDRIFIDGLPAGTAPFAAPGPHHVQVFRGRLQLLASWLELGSPARLRVPDTTRPCSELDLAGVTVSSDGPLPDPGILCEEWAAARPSPLGGVDVAACRASECSQWTHASVGAAPDLTRVNGAQASEGLPAWVTWSAVGVGAAATLGLVLWRAGAFERSEAPTEFVFTGPTAASWRF